MKKENKKERNSSLELLRIICMIFIILHHYAVHSGFTITCDSISFNSVMIKMMSIGGEMACNIFILISGYFLIESKFSLKRLLKLIIKMCTISFSIYIALYAFGLIEFNLKELIRITQTFLYGPWFIVTYVIMYILSPIINKMLKRLGKTEYLKGIVVLLIVKCLIPNLTGNAWSFSPIDTFLIMYIIGAYFRLFEVETKENNNKNAMIFGSLILFIIFSIITFQVLGYKFKNQNLIDKSTFFTKIDNLIAVITAIFIFRYFKNINYSNKFVNYISKSMLGVYIIHEHLILSRFIWNVWSPGGAYIGRKMLIIHVGLKVFMIFVVCIIIDKVVSFVLDNTINRVIETISTNEIANSLIHKILIKMKILFNIKRRYYLENNLQKSIDKQENLV